MVPIGDLHLERLHIKQEGMRLCYKNLEQYISEVKPYGGHGPDFMITLVQPTPQDHKKIICASEGVFYFGASFLDNLLRSMVKNYKGKLYFNKKTLEKLVPRDQIIKGLLLLIDGKDHKGELYGLGRFLQYRHACTHGSYMHLAVDISKTGTQRFLLANGPLEAEHLEAIYSVGGLSASKYFSKSIDLEKYCLTMTGIIRDILKDMMKEKPWKKYEVCVRPAPEDAGGV